MSFDDYAQHMYQKHRLCIAIAIIKTKPPDLTVDQYIQQLNIKMADMTHNNDVTLYSDDFVMDDDDDDDESVNILNGFNEEMDMSQIGEQNNEDVQGTINLPENLTQITCCSPEPTTNNKPNMDSNITCHIIDHNTDYCEEDDLLKCCNRTINVSKSDLNIEKLRPGGNSKYDNMVTNDNTTGAISKPTQNLDLDKTVFDIESKIDIEGKEMNPPSYSNYDSQKTILYTVHGFTENNSHYSQSQAEIYVPNKYLYAMNRNKDIVQDITEMETTITEQNGNINFQNIDTYNEQYVPNVSKDKRNTVLENVYNINNSPGVIVYFSKNHNAIDNSENILNTQNIVTDIVNAGNKEDICVENSQNIDGFFNEINTANESNDVADINTDVKFNATVAITQSGYSQPTNYSPNIDELTNFDSEFISICPTRSLNRENNLKQIERNLTRTVALHNPDTNLQFYAQNNDKVVVDDDTETSELISHKILEELNKIKMYLRRSEMASLEGYSTDSGCRSDSQAGNSNRSASQSSAISINQSAYCLLNYILHCPLVVTTRDITSEISQTLGQLIDRLHDDEIYPPFLEQLLDIVDVLIRQVYRGQSSENCMVLYKDEFIQRALLLNKSGHIQKHCIEEITNILAKFHEKVTDPNVTSDDLTNIDEIENICYIFHMLDILIKRYMKKKDDLSQNSQMSQEDDKIIRRSSITDIWRKKWIPNFQDISEGSRGNRCVLIKCSEILNKIIVDCVNTYSLVTFSALKCFNTTQS